MTTRADCEAADRDDPLAPWRDRFVLPDGLVYLDGNSLGALPRGVPERVRRVVEEEWGRGLIGSWNRAGWVDLPRRVGERIGRLVGAEPGSVVAVDATSVNLFKAVEAALDLRPGRPELLTDTSNFPSDGYVLQGIAQRRGIGLRIVEPEEVEGAIGEEAAVVALTQVDYRSGRRHDLAAVTAAAHAAGALVVWDLAHSAGAFPVDLAGAGADLAVGCGYKYLNGGPGAPAFLYVAPRHQAVFRNPIAGWFGHARPFGFEPGFDPAAGISRGQVGTPHVLSLAALDAALDVFDEVDLEAVRRKSVALTSLFVRLVRDRLAGHGFSVATPDDPERRGSQVALRHPEGRRIVWALAERGVVGDFRAPDVLRFGVAPLYVRHVDIWEAVEALGAVMEAGAWQEVPPAALAPVT